MYIIIHIANDISAEYDGQFMLKAFRGNWITSKKAFKNIRESFEGYPFGTFLEPFLIGNTRKLKFDSVF